jgi:hypothetical protein
MLRTKSLPRRIAIAATAMLLLGSAASQKRTTPRTVEKYRSPDNALVAIVTSTQVPEATRESRVEIRLKAGKVLAKMNYSSENGEQGYGVTKAVWTPDSQYFVYSLESSGGHQAWHSPVQFYNRRHSKIQSLDDALNDSVMNPDFTISAPDKVRVELWFSKKDLTVSLSSLKGSH